MFHKYEYSKSWLNPTDFPTIETDEAQVRQDLQCLHEETRQAIWALIDALASAEGAAGIGAEGKDGATDLQHVVTELLQTAHGHNDTEELERICSAFRGMGVTDTLTDESTALPTAKAVLEQLKASGMADMLQAVYDPDGRKTDIFAYADEAADARAAKEHTHKAADVTSGTIPVIHGGTGASTAAAARTNLGAAASQHTHAAADVIGGYFPVTAGGTGKTSHTANAVLTGNGTSAIKNVPTSSGAFYAAAANGAPQFGTLPIAQGGTGAVTAIEALAKLSALNLDHITDENFLVSSGDDLDTYTTPGAYRISTAAIAKSLLNGPVYQNAGGRLIVMATSTGGTGLMQMIIYNTVSYQIWYRGRSDANIWGSWQSLGTPNSTYPDCRYIFTEDGYEWINPPMLPGIEYRTTERWNGKVVYTKLVDCGTITNGGSIQYSTEEVKPIRFAGYVSGGALPFLMEIPLNSTWKMWVDVQGADINAHVGSGYTDSAARIYVQVWYIK